MELAKLTSRGQITIPIKIRRKLKLKEGDRVFFLEKEGKIYFENASQAALRNLQNEMSGQAVKAGFQSEDDVVTYIKSIRGSSET